MSAADASLRTVVLGLLDSKGEQAVANARAALQRAIEKLDGHDFEDAVGHALDAVENIGVRNGLADAAQELAKVPGSATTARERLRLVDLDES